MLKILVLIFPLILFPTKSLSQVLLLPGPSGYATGTGDCSDIVIGAVSDHWRVTKTGYFFIRAVEQMKRHNDLEFTWSVNNGTILRGQGTWEIEVKPGKTKTKGYFNANGFVDAELTVTRRTEGSKCSVATKTQIAIGKYAESETQVYDMTVTPVSLSEATLSNVSIAKGDRLFRVNAIGIDPYEDPLTYQYYVDAGEIRGTGQNVVWDLSGVAPGTYRITAGVEDSLCGVCKNTVTRVVEIADPDLSK